MRGLNFDSDYLLVKTITKQKLNRTQTKVPQQIKWNQHNLHDAAKLKQYRTCLYNKPKRKEVQQNIEEEWAHTKNTIIESANEVIQTQNTPNRNE
jgi:CRISPR/Cas system-associated endonuclease/helicase Cas3